jgi:GT2 family glycosyltransferase
VITVIVPVYRGAAETRRCLESVLAARVAEPYRVVAIDDATPEPEIAEYLRGLAAAGRVQLIAHAENRGFVHSVNDGLAARAGGAVVLLNSDTEVADGWLDRLAACARREPKTGTVTPFSNNATICSYPRVHDGNRLPDGTSTAELDRIFAAVNAGQSVEIPTAVGFCMLITEECLRGVGGFDAETFGRGYGEEVDFCMRAARAGFRHRLAADVFVFHAGEVSFKGDGAERRRAAQAIIDQRYPEFLAGLREYLDKEPARPLRRAVDRERIRRSPRPRTLLVASRNGTPPRTLADLPRGLDPEREEILALFTGNGPASVLMWLKETEEFEVGMPSRHDLPALGPLLRDLGVTQIHLQDIRGLPTDVLALPLGIGAQIRDERMVELELERDTALARVRAIEQSTSWRITGPLRRLVGLLRGEG